MKIFDYIIIGGGCAGLSLAYELEINDKLNSKTLAIIEPGQNTRETKLGPFGKFSIIILKTVLKSWIEFSIKTSV